MPLTQLPCISNHSEVRVYEFGEMLTLRTGRSIGSYNPHCIAALGSPPSRAAPATPAEGRQKSVILLLIFDFSVYI